MIILIEYDVVEYIYFSLYNRNRLETVQYSIQENKIEFHSSNKDGLTIVCRYLYDEYGFINVGGLTKYDDI